MLDVIIGSLVVSLIINGLMFLVAFWRQSDKLTDISYAATFMALALYAYLVSDKSVYATVGLLVVGLWAVRIGGFLLYRVIKTGKDTRFDGIRERFWKFGKFWLGQAITVWVLMLAAMLAFTHDTAWSLVSVIGIIVWFVGLVLEATADLQKYRFSRDPKNKGAWIDEGVWRYSRHPNYFGEILVWVGVYLLAFPALIGWEKVIGLASPVLIICLLLFVSGVPLLEKAADARWGNEPAYKRYKRRTSILILLPKRKS